MSAPTRRGPRTRRDCTHPVAQHQHGTRTAYTLDGCRCEPCTQAANTYEKTRRRLKAYGRWDSGFTDATEAHQHVHALRAAGIGYRHVAQLAGVRICTVQRLLAGKSATIKTATANAILAIPLDKHAPGARIDPTGAMRRVRALTAIGWGLNRIAAESGVNEQTLRDVLYGRPILERTARRVQAVYQRLWDQRPDTSTPHLASGVTRTRRWAARNGWAPPLAWDDDTIDDPAATPQGVERVSRYGHTADDLAEDVHHLLAAGTTRDEIAARTGRDPRSIERELARHGHHRLAAWLHTGQEPAHDAA